MLKNIPFISPGEIQRNIPSYNDVIPTDPLSFNGEEYPPPHLIKELEPVPAEIDSVRITPGIQLIFTLIRFLPGMVSIGTHTPKQIEELINF